MARSRQLKTYLTMLCGGGIVADIKDSCLHNDTVLENARISSLSKKEWYAPGGYCVKKEKKKEEKKSWPSRNVAAWVLVRNRRMVMVKVKESQSWRTQTSLYRERVKRASIQRSIPDMGCITGL